MPKIYSLFNSFLTLIIYLKSVELPNFPHRKIPKMNLSLISNENNFFTERLLIVFFFDRRLPKIAWKILKKCKTKGFWSIGPILSWRLKQCERMPSLACTCTCACVSIYFNYDNTIFLYKKSSFLINFMRLILHLKITT